MNRDPKRIPIILKQLEALWSSSPDLRLGQLILGALSNGTPEHGFFYAVGGFNLTHEQSELAINESKADSFDKGYNIEDEALLTLISHHLK